MKFINYLESITGIGIYPLVAFVIFFGFFILVTLYVFRGDKRRFSSISQIPLDQH